MRKARWARLLEENPEFRRWYKNLSRGSEGTANERARVLYRFLVKNDMTVDSILELAREDVRNVEDILFDFMSKLYDEGKSPGYMENYLKAVKSWLKFNGILLVRSINIGNRNSTPTIDDERVPTPDELQQILKSAKLRGGCSISFMAYSGIRPMSLGKSDGSDGLEVRDLPEMRIEGGKVSFDKLPTRMVVRSNISKTSKEYLTFLASEGCEYLKAYLEERLSMGEELGPSSAIITYEKGYRDTGLGSPGRKSDHITTKAITQEIRRAMRPKFKWRPYVLRSYFATQLLLGESNGKITHSYRQFFMGHQGDMLSRYTTNKGKLPESVIESMRSAFRNCEEYLSTRKARGEDPEMTTIRTMVESGVLDIQKPNVRAYLLKKLGIDDMEMKVARMREAGLEEDEAEANVNAGELGLDPMSLEALRSKRVKNTKKIVSEDELLEHLDDGWDIFSTLPSGSIVVRKVTYR